MTERYSKAILWNTDERFPHDVLIILDTFSIFTSRNQSIDLPCKSTDWFLFDANFGV